MMIVLIILSYLLIGFGIATILTKLTKAKVDLNGWEIFQTWEFVACMLLWGIMIWVAMAEQFGRLINKYMEKL